ncbi:aldo/keto reductase [Halococcus qingdaonensis]|uniref:aldo/keto reductase n=1 Tax=Halococcus qingdaonensis TaxID=224402 RepID=UPI0021166DF0|nr:aldo/keto reductase [Halococcus qingdaonensis]
MRHVTVDGVDVPALGFGTAGMDTDEERQKAVEAALAAGYRHIDTAQMYDSESAVGAAVEESDVAREELFVTTKLTRDNRAHEAVIDSTQNSLDRLGMEYVDLLLIHSPDQNVPHEETLDAMDELVADGLVNHIGVSNFSVEQTRNAVDHSAAPIFTNQVEYSLATHQPDLLSFCIDEDVLLTAYSPLKLGSALEDEELVAVAETHGKTVRQVAIRWLLQQPMVSTIPRSSNPDHIERNSAVFDFELADEEMRRLFGIGGGIDEELAATIGL